LAPLARAFVERGADDRTGELGGVAHGQVGREPTCDRL
jgi:hypothetical protein